MNDFDGRKESWITWVEKSRITVSHGEQETRIIEGLTVWSLYRICLYCHCFDLCLFYLGSLIPIVLFPPSPLLTSLNCLDHLIKI